MSAETPRITTAVGGDPDRPRGRRRPYEKPAILWREPLEAMASECTSVPGGKSDALCVVAFS